MQFRVAMGKFVDFKSSYTTERELTQKAKVRDSDDIAKLKAKTLSNHDAIFQGEAGGPTDFKLLSMDMARQNVDSTQTFAGERNFDVSFLDDIKMVEESKEEEQTEEESTASEPDTGDPATGERGAPGVKGAKWYDLERGDRQGP